MSASIDHASTIQMWHLPTYDSLSIVTDLRIPLIFSVVQLLYSSMPFNRIEHKGIYDYNTEKVVMWRADKLAFPETGGEYRKAFKLKSDPV